MGLFNKNASNELKDEVKQKLILALRDSGELKLIEPDKNNKNLTEMNLLHVLKMENITVAIKNGSRNVGPDSHIEGTIYVKDKFIDKKDRTITIDGESFQSVGGFESTINDISVYGKLNENEAKFFKELNKEMNDLPGLSDSYQKSIENKEKINTSFITEKHKSFFVENNVYKTIEDIQKKLNEEMEQIKNQNDKHEKIISGELKPNKQEKQNFNNSLKM